MDNNEVCDINKIKEVFNKQRDFYNKHIIDNVYYRLNKLKLLKKVIKDEEKNISKALELDLGKTSTESYMSEIGMVLDDLSYTIRHLKSWTKDKKVHTPLAQFPSASYIKKVSLGNVLIISPWNYPFLLSIHPLIGAIAAGNTAILKPSEYSPNVSKEIKILLSKVFNEEYVACILGEKEVASELLKQDFNYIFYTGSSSVGKIVMNEASKKLIPVTLELGGKSPCIVDKNSNYKMAAKRIIFGKILNAGQTCVSPDYVLVHEDIREDFIKYLKLYIKEFLGKNIIDNKEYPRIVNIKQFNRLVSLIEEIKDYNNKNNFIEAENKNNIKIYGGKIDTEKLKIEPIIIDLNNIKDNKNVIDNLKIMQDEIFGPILPIISYNNINDAINYINSKDRPLALYLFTNKKELEQEIFTKVRFGGGCINDTIIHLANNKLPFGGIGNSGMGSYNGKYTFNIFSHELSIVKKSTIIDLPMRYHPYRAINNKIIRIFMK